MSIDKIPASQKVAASVAVRLARTTVGSPEEEQFAALLAHGTGGDPAQLVAVVRAVHLAGGEDMAEELTKELDDE